MENSRKRTILQAGLLLFASSTAYAATECSIIKAQRSVALDEFRLAVDDFNRIVRETKKSSKPNPLFVVYAAGQKIDNKLVRNIEMLQEGWQLGCFVDSADEVLTDVKKMNGMHVRLRDFLERVNQHLMERKKD